MYINHHSFSYIQHILHFIFFFFFWRRCMGNTLKLLKSICTFTYWYITETPTQDEGQQWSTKCSAPFNTKFPYYIIHLPTPFQLKLIRLGSHGVSFSMHILAPKTCILHIKICMQKTHLYCPTDMCGNTHQWGTWSRIQRGKRVGI